MTYQNDFTLSAALLGQLTADGLKALPTLFSMLLNAAMQIEWQKHLEAAPHERTEERTDNAPGGRSQWARGMESAKDGLSRKSPIMFCSAC